MVWPLLAVAVLVVGCASIDYREHMRARRLPARYELPPIVIDRRACQLDLVFKPGVETDFVRDEVLTGIETSWNAVAGRREPVAARVKIWGELDEEQTWIIYHILFWGAPLVIGLPVANADAHVEVTVEAAGRLYKGRGAGTCYAGLYYPGSHTQCAFSKAVVDALGSAVRQKPSSVRRGENL